LVAGRRKEGGEKGRRADAFSAHLLVSAGEKRREGNDFSFTSSPLSVLGKKRGDRRFPISRI